MNMGSAHMNHGQLLGRHAEQVAELQMAPVDGELVLRRIFDAPPEMVFKAWSEPTQVARWFGPCELRMTVREMDVRPGGALRMEGLCEAGASVRIQGEYREVEEPDWIVYADACFLGDTLICETLATVTFHEVAGEEGRDADCRTRVTIHCEPVLGFDAFAQRRWAEGWHASLERLAAHLATPSCGVAAELDAGACCV
ncbi:SRPBCC domain-containing protein [Uliginosibacterium sp. H3]|uniref:SRPBCC domain-containing protein n=1 Tax=Uliginosibacterium silvisoli TaxID=3114758 RepID=A0ABU6K6K2_9RHOO|nr:SRPBCC domain-containing protein [Uliginosibacterium sp. H3]